MLAAFHAYKFTHYEAGAAVRTSADGMTLEQKIRAAVTGVSLPRPENETTPSDPFEDVILPHPNGRIHAWWVFAKGAKETVILFHGYGASKSSMVDRAGAFRRMGYNTMLVDFTGSGDSEGSTTSIGFKEGAEVRACLDWAVQNHRGAVHLFGTSLGAAAILKAVADGAQPSSIILECPFGSLLQAVKNRCELVGIPPTPVAHLVTFWGGAELGFNAFEHNPQDYASAVRCPALLTWGEADERVIRTEIDAIYARLSGPKKLVTLPGVGHENYLRADRTLWLATVGAFLTDGMKKQTAPEG